MPNDSDTLVSAGEGQARRQRLFAIVDSRREIWEVCDTEFLANYWLGTKKRAYPEGCTVRELSWQLAKATPPAPDLREALWKLQPDEQAWWWHWNGEDYSIPHIFSVMVSKSGSVDRYFVSYPDSRWCDEIGGFWLKVAYPNVPTHNEQAKLRAALAGKEKA